MAHTTFTSTGDILNFVLSMRLPKNVPAVRNSLDGNRIATKFKPLITHSTQTDCLSNRSQSLNTGSHTRALTYYTTL